MLNDQIVLSCFKMCHVTQSISWHQEIHGNSFIWNPEIQLTSWWYQVNGVSFGRWVYCPHPIWGYVTMSKKMRHAKSWLNPSLFSLSRSLKQVLFSVAGQLHSSSHQFLAPSIPVSTGHVSEYGGAPKKIPKICPWRNLLKNKYVLRVIPTLKHCSDIVSDILLSGSKYY